MKLYMKQKVFSWKDKFTVKDERGEDRYFVEGKVLSVGKKLTVTDHLGREAAFIHQKVLSFMPRFFVDIDGAEVAEIVKKFTLFKPKYQVKGPGWDVQGSVFEHNYQITEGGAPVVSIYKKWMAWGDTFELDIAPGTNEVLAVAVVLAIDAVMDSQAAAAAASN